MIAASAVLYAVASELAEQAKAALPELCADEIVNGEWLENGIYYRETVLNGETYISQYDFKQRKSRRVAVGGDVND